MNFNDIKELISLIDQSELSSFQYQKDGLKLKIEKNKPVSVNMNKKTEAVTTLQVESTKAEEIISSDEPVLAPVMIKGHSVKSPLVGVYYGSPNPTSDAYVKVGQQVAKGDVLCIIEAMKVMNEIVAEQDGEILEICVANESLVEYGQTLVRIG